MAGVQVLVQEGNRAEVGRPAPAGPRRVPRGSWSRGCRSEQTALGRASPASSLLGAPGSSPASGKCPAATPPRPVPAPPPSSARAWAGRGEREAGPRVGKARSGGSPSLSKPTAQRAVPPPPRGGTCRRGGSPRRQRRGEGERCEVRGPSAAPLGSSGSPPAPSPPLFRSSPLASEGLGPAGPGPGLPQRTPSSPSHPAFREGAVHQGLRSPGTSGDLVRTRKRAHLLGAPRCQAWYRDALAQAVPRATPARPESQSLGARDP